jgi:preprotein translocase subunit SecA
VKNRFQNQPFKCNLQRYSVERSEEIGRLLDEDGIAYELLNAKPENVEREAEIVAQSGRRGGGLCTS